MDREERWDCFYNDYKEVEKSNLNNISPMAVQLADLLCERENNRILDLGCGMGRHMHYLARRRLPVIGCDISEEMLLEAERISKKLGLNLDFVRGDYLSLPFNNSVFTGVLSISTLHHDFPENIVKALKEIRRVMSPGGYFAFDPPSTNDQHFGRGRALGEKIFINHKIPHYFFDEEEIVNLLERLFFTIIKMDTISYYQEMETGIHKREKYQIIVRKEQPIKMIGNAFQRFLM